MDMYSALLLEKAKREKARRQQAGSGRPNVIEEMHQDISVKDRALAKNFASNTDQMAKFIGKQTGLQTKVYNGDVIVKRENEREWRKLDPDAEGFDGFGELAMDAGDIVADVGIGAAEGLSAAAAAAAGLLGTGGLASVPAAMGASAVTGAAGESLRQGIGRAVGVNEEMDSGNILASGVIGGLLPGAGAALKGGAKAAKGGIKGAFKFLGNVDDEAISKMTREGEEAIRKIEDETALPTLDRLSEGLGRKVTKVEAQKSDNIMKEMGNYNIGDDAQLKEILTLEIAKEKAGSNNFAKIKGLMDKIKDIDETKPVRDQISKIGADNEKALRKAAFPSVSKSLDDLEGMSSQMKDDMLAKFEEAGQEYARQYEGKVANAQFFSSIKDDFIKKNFTENFLKTDNGKKMLGAVDNYFNSKFQVDNRGAIKAINISSPEESYKYGYKAQVDVTPEDMSRLGIERDKFLPQSENFDVLSDRVDDITSKAYTTKTNTPTASLQDLMTGSTSRSTSPYIGFDDISMNDLQSFKNLAAKDAKFMDTNAIKTSTSDIESKFAKSMVKGIGDRLKMLTEGGKTLADAEYKKVLAANDVFNKNFSTAKKSNAALKRAINGDDVTMDEIKRLDNVLGTNYGDFVNDAIKAKELTKKGIGISKQLTKSSAFAERKAKKAMSNKDKLFERLSKRTGDSNTMLKNISDYSNKNDLEFISDVDRLADNYGDDVAKEFKQAVDDFSLAAIFGDSSKTGLKEIKSGQAANVARGAAQATAYQAVSAGGAQIAGAAGKALGEKLPVRKILRKTLPAYYEKKEALKELSKSAKDSLEKKIGDSVIRRRDLIRELSKKMAQDKVRD